MLWVAAVLDVQIVHEVRVTRLVSSSYAIPLYITLVYC